MNGARFGVGGAKWRFFYERDNELLGFLKAEESYLLKKCSIVKRLCLVRSSLGLT